jgi:hypothetical protein
MYAKVFDTMWDGSLAGSGPVWAVFVFLLAKCDADGNVDIHPAVIASLTGFPIEQVKDALLKLQSPDPDSRSPEEAGARIILMDDHREWGWSIVNHAKYRGLKDKDMLRHQTRERVAKHRNALKRPVTPGNASKRHTDADAEAHTEAEAEAPASASSKPPQEKKHTVASRPPFSIPTLEEVRTYCQERLRLGKRAPDPEAWLDHYVSNGWRVGKNPMRDWRAAVRTWERHELNGNGAGRKSGTMRPSEISAFAAAMRQKEGQS